MEYLIGVLLALCISIGDTAIGFDRGSFFSSLALSVIALYYALFAIMSSKEVSWNIGSLAFPRAPRTS